MTKTHDRGRPDMRVLMSRQPGALLAERSSHTLAADVHRVGLTASHPQRHVDTLGRWGQERP